jgi:hypothetical protein
MPHQGPFVNNAVDTKNQSEEYPKIKAGKNERCLFMVNEELVDPQIQKL